MEKPASPVTLRLGEGEEKTFKNTDEIFQWLNEERKFWSWVGVPEQQVLADWKGAWESLDKAAKGYQSPGGQERLESQCAKLGDKLRQEADACLFERRCRLH